MKLYYFIYRFGMLRSKGEMKKRFGKEYTKDFYKAADRYFPDIAEKTPDIGNTAFAFNYAFTPAYIAWYKAACELNTDIKGIEQILWLMNEKIITTVPSFARKTFGKKCIKSLRKKALIHEKIIADGKIHPYDYIIECLSDDVTQFEVNFKRCGMKTLAADFDALGIFPTVCRVDYMVGAYLGIGFERTKTLGDGDECCNCRYISGGKCEWNPEKGFEKRK